MIDINAVLETICPTCKAGIGEECKTQTFTERNIRFHRERYRLSQRRTDALPSFPETLTSTDKALITYYAFIMLCNSCSERSMLLFNRMYSSEELQKFFAKKAIQTLQKDGLLADTAKVQDGPKTTEK